MNISINDNNYEGYELRAERMNEYIQKEHPCSGIRLHWM